MNIEQTANSSRKWQNDRRYTRARMHSKFYSKMCSFPVTSFIYGQPFQMWCLRFCKEKGKNITYWIFKFSCMVCIWGHTWIHRDTSTSTSYVLVLLPNSKFKERTLTALYGFMWLKSIEVDETSIFGRVFRKIRHFILWPWTVCFYTYGIFNRI